MHSDIITIKIFKMNRIIILFLNFVFCFTLAYAQGGGSDNLLKKAEAENTNGNIAPARNLYIQAYHQYIANGQMEKGVECAAKAAALYYTTNLYNEAFDFLRSVDESISKSRIPRSKREALLYQTSRERMKMYVRMRRAAGANTQLEAMWRHSEASDDEQVKNDFLYNKVIYLYTFGEHAKGNVVFKEMAAKLTQSKEYDKVDKVYKTLIENGRKSGSAQIVDQSYKSYILWKDSVDMLKHAAHVDSLKQQIANNESVIAEQQSTLATRAAFITVFGIIIGVLVVALVIGFILFIRTGIILKKQKKTILEAQENIALKAHFISNISAQLNPTFQKLDQKKPEVKSLMDFSAHVQQLSELETMSGSEVGKEDVQVQAFCESLMDHIRDKVKSEVVLTVNAPKMTVSFNKEYVSHIILHLLQNAADNTPAEGHIRLEFKKRGAHSFQFLVSDTGNGIPQEKQETVFRPFAEVRDLSKGDGLGLPICRQMAVLMNGDLTIDPDYVKGARFVLDIHD